MAGSPLWPRWPMRLGLKHLLWNRGAHAHQHSSLASLLSAWQDRYVSPRRALLSNMCRRQFHLQEPRAIRAASLSEQPDLYPPRALFDSPPTDAAPFSPRARAKRKPETRALNDQLNLALVEEATLQRVKGIVDAARSAVFDHWTLDFALRNARHALHAEPRERLAFAIRMVARARDDGARLDSFALLQLLPLAKALYKVNVVIAVKNLVEAQNHTLNEKAYSGLITHLSVCGRVKLMQRTFRERLHVYPTPTADLICSVAYGLLRNRRPDAALTVWQTVRNGPDTLAVPLDASLLECGAWICATGDDKADHARWIGYKYRELGLKPPSAVLHVLSTAFINAGHYEEAREYMRWIMALGYTLHERRMYQYMPDCIRRAQAHELLPLSDVLTEAKYLGSDFREQLRVLHAYLRTLGECASRGRLDAQEARRCAKRVAARWKLTDSRSTMFLKFLLELRRDDTEQDKGVAGIHAERAAHGPLSRESWLERDEEL